jgi:3',5'-cyclic AMP phosphodiesterase CpdA
VRDFPPFDPLFRSAMLVRALTSVVALSATVSACQGAPAPAAAVLPSAPPSRLAGAAPTPPTVLAFARGAQRLFVGAGDIASCDETADEATADMLDRIVAANAGTTVFTAGDNVYPDGATEEFAQCYAPNWGRHRARTIPTIGNHDVRTDNGRPYHDYFGPKAGTHGESWAAHTVGPWKILVLNSNCDRVACSAEGPQARWLAAQLAAHEGTPGDAGRRACTVALWHHPRFSSGPHGDTRAMGPIFDLLSAHEVELVLSGHDHHYERFGPLTPGGEPAPEGVVQIVAGTGGKHPYELDAIKPGSLARVPGVAGLLTLDLRDGEYEGRFATTDDVVRDAFAGRCR